MSGGIGFTSPPLPDEAVTRVLNVVPEGWSASILDGKVKPSEAKALGLAPGQVRELAK
jgi:hypothetical protein